MRREQAEAIAAGLGLLALLALCVTVVASVVLALT